MSLYSEAYEKLLVKVLADFDAVEDKPGLLKEKGIRGQIGTASECVAARYLTGIVRETYPDLTVSLGRETYLFKTGQFSEMVARTTTPQSVVDFYTAFDHGKYPELQEVFSGCTCRICSTLEATDAE